MDKTRRMLSGGWLSTALSNLTRGWFVGSGAYVFGTRNSIFATFRDKRIYNQFRDKRVFATFRDKRIFAGDDDG